jgi:hypothetical protein
LQHFETVGLVLQHFETVGLVLQHFETVGLVLCGQNLGSCGGVLSWEWESADAEAGWLHRCAAWLMLKKCREKVFEELQKRVLTVTHRANAFCPDYPVGPNSANSYAARPRPALFVTNINMKRLKEWIVCEVVSGSTGIQPAARQIRSIPQLPACQAYLRD